MQKASTAQENTPGVDFKYLVNIDSTYQYRPIQGATRLSPHSHGIAIELENKYTCY